MIGYGEFRPSLLDILAADPRVTLSASGSWLDSEAVGDQ